MLSFDLQPTGNPVQTKTETTVHEKWSTATCQKDSAGSTLDPVSSSSCSSNDLESCDNNNPKEFTNKSQEISSTPFGQQSMSIRMLMSGKEVGSIIGKRGENVKKYREESGARINISDGSCPERIVTVTGSPDQIAHAYSMMCLKFEDDFTQSLQRYNYPSQEISCPPVTLRLLVPATQCGSIIGKGGCKIKDIRELTGASIQVAIELLPQSSERTVTVSGTAKAISRCIRQLCDIIQQTPLKGTAIPYRPKPPLPDAQVPPLQQASQQPASNNNNSLMNALAVVAGVTTNDQKASNVQLNVQTATNQPFVDFSMVNSRQNNLFTNALVGFTNQSIGSQMDLVSQLGEVEGTNQSQFKALSSSTTTTTTTTTPFEDPATTPSSSLAGRSLPMDTSATGHHLMNNMSVNAQLLANVCPFLLGQEASLLDVTQSMNLCANANFYNALQSGPATVATGPTSGQDYLSGLLASTNPTTSLNYFPMTTTTQGTTSTTTTPVSGPLVHQGLASSPNPFRTSMIPGIINESFMIHPNGDYRYELIITNDLIGCIIGRGGNKINEIRQLSLATIKISSCEDGLSDRKISITGNPQCVQMAHILIMNSIFSRESAEYLKSLSSTSGGGNNSLAMSYPTTNYPYRQAFQNSGGEISANPSLFRHLPILLPMNYPPINGTPTISANPNTELSGDVQSFAATAAASFLFPTVPMSVQY